MKTTLLKHLYDRSGAYKFSILHSPLFIAGLIVKLYASAFFGGMNFTTLFIPFFKQYTFGTIDPYVYFFDIGLYEVFPYPSLMLYIMSIPGQLLKPLISPEVFSINNIELFIYHLPLLVADIFILLVLSRWLKDKHHELLVFYWLSPILLYINYIHSQLDVIPIALVFGFLYYLFKEKLVTSFLFLSAAIAAKFHIVLLIPFTVVYLWRKQRPLLSMTLLLFSLVFTFLVVNIARLSSPEFLSIVFANREQIKVFDLIISLGSTHVIYVLPLAYTILLIHSLTFRHLNRDTFVMFLGFSLGLLTIFIPPQPGWYYWFIPFLVYFYVKNERFSKSLLVFLTVAYLSYFALTPDSDYLTILANIYPTFADVPNLHQLLSSRGLDAELAKNVAFTVLQAVLMLNVIWLYRRGVEQSKKQKLYNMPYLIGIAGDSGSGKSTLASLLSDLFGQKNTALVAGDAMHKWERGHERWQSITHLNPRANALHEDIFNAASLRAGEDIYRRNYNHTTGQFTLPEKLESKRIVIFEGLHSFYLTQMQKALDLKVFIKPDNQLRTHWKVRRDITKRGYSKEKVLAQLKDRAQDAENYISVQEKYADIMFSLKSLVALTDDVIGTDFEPPIYLEIKCGNTICLEPFLDSISKYVNIEHAFTDKHQIVSLIGTVSGEVLEHLSFLLVPELYDITIDPPKWSDNHDGIMQLFTTFYVLQLLQYRTLNNHSLAKPKLSKLTHIANCAQSIGKELKYVQGGGGNVSLKINDTTMAVKASGLRLEELQEHSGFVGINYTIMRRFFNKPLLEQENLANEYEKVAKESRVKLAYVPESTLRPSIETGFHALLDTAVIHTHSVYVNMLACAKEGRDVLHTLFPEANYIPYHTPGVDLTFAISAEMKKHPANVYFLENHGVVVCGGSAEEAFKRHELVNTKIKKWLGENRKLPDVSITTQTSGQLISNSPSLTELIRATADILDQFSSTILFPDQVVYCKKFGFANNQPININKETGIITYNLSYKEAQAFIETFVAWIYIQQGILMRGFTLQTISSEEGVSITNMESEKYRQRLIS